VSFEASATHSWRSDALNFSPARGASYLDGLLDHHFGEESRIDDSRSTRTFPPMFHRNGLFHHNVTFVVENTRKNIFLRIRHLWRTCYEIPASNNIF